MSDAIGYLLVVVVLVVVYKLIKQGWAEGAKSDGADRKPWDAESRKRTNKGNAAQQTDPLRTPEYRIEYVDADGVITTREISPASDNGTKYSLRAFCFLRNEWRTFLLERMRKVWKLNGAVILTSEEFYYDMRGRLEEFRGKQPEMRAQEDAYWARQQERMGKEAKAIVLNLWSVGRLTAMRCCSWLTLARQTTDSSNPRKM